MSTFCMLHLLVILVSINAKGLVIKIVSFLIYYILQVISANICNKEPIKTILISGYREKLILKSLDSYPAVNKTIHAEFIFVEKLKIVKRKAN